MKGADQAYYRVHGAQMGTERVTLVDLRERRASYDAVFDSYSNRIPGATDLRKRAHRLLAREALWEACRAHERRRMESTPVAELTEYALSTEPQVRRLREYWALRWRQRVGPRACPYLQPIIWSAAYRRVRARLAWRRWHRHGV